MFVRGFGVDGHGVNGHEGVVAPNINAFNPVGKMGAGLGHHMYLSRLLLVVWIRRRRRCRLGGFRLFGAVVNGGWSTAREKSRDSENCCGGAKVFQKLLLQAMTSRQTGSSQIVVPIIRPIG